MFLERQCAVIKQPANLGFGVLDRGLVEYAVNPARQHRIDVGHQVNVVTVVMTKIREIVREVLTAGEVLFERREAAAKRVPSSVDDLRIRQYQMYQPDIQPIVGQFIDIERRGGLAINARRVEIALAEAAQLRGIKCGHRLEEWGLVVPLVAPGEFPRNLRQVRQLHGAFDRRVAG